MKKSENADASEHADGVDMISNLPDHLLLLILSRLPGTEEAIRTSVLSTRWMYLWTLMPSIDIDYTRGLGPHRSLHRDGFNDFVYWVLLNKPQDLDSFRLSCPDNCNMLTIRQWIHAAVMRKVKLIDLTLCPRATYGGMLYEKIEVPHCLMTCGSLEVLRLRLLGPRHCLPYIHGFSALRALELNNVEFSDYTIKNCPLLEDFSLIDCFAYDLKISNPKLKNLRIDNRQLFGDKEAAANKFGLIRGMCQGLEISCPKLVFLKLIGYVAMFFLFEDLYSLKEAVIHPKGLYELEPPTSDLFTGIPHVEFLSISLYCIRACFDPEVNYPISLPNLKKLELIVDGKNMDLLIPFLKCLPDLESLHFIIPKDICSLDKWNLDEAATMSILTRHLKKVEFRVFDEENSKLVVARALLEHGNELEELVFSWDNEARFHERSMETMNEVSKFHKASSTVRLRCVIKPIQDNS